MTINFKNPLTTHMTSILKKDCLICAKNQNRSIILPKDIILSVLDDRQEIGCQILEIAGMNINNVKKMILNIDPDLRNKNKATEPFHPVSNFILQKADIIASQMGHAFVGTEHVILAFLHYKGKEPHIRKIVSIFEGNGIQFDIFKDAIINYYMSSSSEISYGEHDKKVSTQNADGDEKKENVDNNLFLKNITKRMLKEPINFIGREIEFERAVRILSRKKKNNILLVGREGTGKSSFIEGLAKKIIDGEIAGKLKDTTILSLDLAAMIAGTKYRGQFEERMKGVIDFLSKKRENEKYILFIDEIHQILSTGSSFDGAVDAGSIIKTELSNGTIQCIGATTTKEYKKYLLKDGPLIRRMSPIFIEEPNLDETINILKGIKEEYEKYHEVIVSDEVINEIVKLSNLYIHDRYFPDKAIDILDEVCTRKSIECSKPVEIDIIESQLYKIKKKIEQAKTRNYNKIKSLVEEKELLSRKLEIIKKKYEDVLNSNTKEIHVDLESVRKVVADFSGIPINNCEKEFEKLLKMEEYLNSIIINQKEAVNKICQAVYRTKAGLKDPERPAGVFVFLGSTGSGKTWLAKNLAKYHFGNKNKFIRLDMSEYMEKHTISKIIGSPAGYVGYDDVGNRFVDKVKINPYSVILLDEFEKAHPDIFNLFLQVFDEGRLTDSHGDTIDLRNTIIIMTSNIGVSKLNKKSMGFDSESSIGERSKILVDELKKLVSPEFFNRIDEVVVFNHLDKDSILSIFENELSIIKNRILEKNINIDFSEKAKDFIIEKGYSEKYGARPMKRSLQRYIADPLSLKIISGECNSGSTVYFDYTDGCEDDNLEITIKEVL